MSAADKFQQKTEAQLSIQEQLAERARRLSSGSKKSQPSPVRSAARVTESVPSSPDDEVSDPRIQLSPIADSVEANTRSSDIRMSDAIIATNNGINNNNNELDVPLVLNDENENNNSNNNGRWWPSSLNFSVLSNSNNQPSVDCSRIWTRIKDGFIDYHCRGGWMTRSVWALWLLLDILGLSLAVNWGLSLFIYTLLCYFQFIFLCLLFSNYHARLEPDDLSREWLIGTSVGCIMYLIYSTLYNSYNGLIIGPLIWYSNPQSFVEYDRPHMVTASVLISLALSIVPALMITMRITPSVRASDNGNNNNQSHVILFSTIVTLTLSYYGALILMGLLLTAGIKVHAGSTLIMFILSYLLISLPIVCALCSLFATLWKEFGSSFALRLDVRSYVAAAAIAALGTVDAFSAAMSNVYYRVDLRLSIMGFTVALGLLITSFLWSQIFLIRKLWSPAFN